MLSITNEHEIAVIEMGANHIGEIEFLCGISLPTHGIITNIGRAHLEGFGSYEGVARAKSELYMHLLQNEGIAFINENDDLLKRMAGRLKNVKGYGKDNAMTMAQEYPFITYRNNAGNEINTNLFGGYNFVNMEAADKIGEFFGVSLEQRDQALSTYTSDNNRSQVVKWKEKTIILDAYNANPSSMEVAIKNFARAEGSKAVVLGDMFELGVESQAEHQQIVKLCIESGIEERVYVGKHFSEVASVDPEGVFHVATDAAIHALQSFSSKNILIKGSRGMQLERLVKGIKACFLLSLFTILRGFYAMRRFVLLLFAFTIAYSSYAQNNVGKIYLESFSIRKGFEFYRAFPESIEKSTYSNVERSFNLKRASLRRRLFSKIEKDTTFVEGDNVDTNTFFCVYAL